MAPGQGAPRTKTVPRVRSARRSSETPSQLLWLRPKRYVIGIFPMRVFCANVSLAESPPLAAGIVTPFQCTPQL